MAKRSPSPQFLLCVKNDDYPASLEVRKVYRALLDSVAGTKGFVRVIDESGEDYLYPADHFVVIDLPKEAVDALLTAS